MLELEEVHKEGMVLLEERMQEYSLRVMERNTFEEAINDSRSSVLQPPVRLSI